MKVLATLLAVRVFRRLEGLGFRILRLKFRSLGLSAHGLECKSSDFSVKGSEEG